MTSQPQISDFASVTTDDLVTGEAVALDLPPAGIGSRMVSGGIDIIATLMLLFGVAMILSISTLRADGALQWIAYIGTTVLSFIVFPTALETLTSGKSLGKKLMGLRTVRDDAGPITFHHALVRALVGYVEIYALSGMPAFLSAMMSVRGKRLGDYAAGTYVVRDRVPLRLAPPPPMPPALAGWAQQADVAGLPTGLTLAVRQYLSRSALLEPSARQQIGDQLAGQVSQYVAPPPPAHTSHEDFLAAVIATRRDRDLARLQRDAALRQRLTGR